MAKFLFNMKNKRLVKRLTFWIFNVYIRFLRSRN